jgi:hypothetical protein
MGLKNDNYSSRLTGRVLDRYVRLFQRCYEIEQEQTPEDRRGTASRNDALVIEALRLGGSTGLPRGLYPPQFVSEVFDRAAKERISKPAVSQEEEQYLSDIHTLKQRLGRCRVPGRVMAELFSTGSLDSFDIGRVVIDRDTGKGYEIEGQGIHSLKMDNMDILIQEMATRGIIDEHEFLNLMKKDLFDGFYLVNQSACELTESVVTKVVKIKGVGGVERCADELRTIEQYPLKSYPVLATIEDEMGRGFGHYSCNPPPVMEDFSPAEQDELRQVIQRERENARTLLADAQRAAEIGWQRKEYVFVSERGEVLEAE